MTRTSSPGPARPAAGFLSEVAAQGFVSGGGAELQDIGQVGALEDGLHTPAKGVERKKFAGGAGDGEANDVAVPMGRRGDGGVVAAIQDFGPVDAFGAVAGDETAASYLSGYQALGFQEFVGGGDGGPVQSKLASQFAGGGEPFAAGQDAGPNLIRNLLE